MQKLRNHVLAQTFRELKGNPKWSICTEPLWFIPYSLFMPFQTLYMRKLGLSSVEIGTTVTVGFILQMFCALITMKIFFTMAVFLWTSREILTGLRLTEILIWAGNIWIMQNAL